MKLLLKWKNSVWFSSETFKHYVKTQVWKICCYIYSWVSNLIWCPWCPTQKPLSIFSNKVLSVVWVSWKLFFFLSDYDTATMFLYSNHYSPKRVSFQWWWSKLSLQPLFTSQRVERLSQCLQSIWDVWRKVTIGYEVTINHGIPWVNSCPQVWHLFLSAALWFHDQTSSFIPSLFYVTLPPSAYKA